MKFYTAIFLSLSFFISQKSFSTDAKIAFRVNTPSSSDTATVIVQRALAGVDKHAQIYVGKGSFASLPFEQGMNASVKFKGRTYPIYTFPGDSLTITFDSLPHFEGKSGKDNAAFFQFNVGHSSTYKPENLKSQILAKTIDQYEIWLYEQRYGQNMWLSHQDVSPDLKLYLEAAIRYNYWEGLFAYPIEKANAATQGFVTPIPATMTEGFDANTLNELKLLEVESYRHFLVYYITYLTSESNQFRKFTDMGTSTERKNAQAYNNLKGENAVYIAAKFLSENATKMSEPVLKHQLTLLDEQDTKKHYVKYVAGIIKTALADMPKPEKANEQAEKKSSSGKSEYPFVLTDMDGKSVTLESFKGKVVYMDFWASWCGPCRMMFPYSKQLHEKLSDKQKKQIAFVYVSIDATPEAWKGAVQQMQLTNGVNLLSQGNWQSEVVKYFKINSIPRYMIFDKKGNLADSNAKRPADPAMLEDLLKLLE